MFDFFRRSILFLVGATLPMAGFNLGSIGRFQFTPNKLLTAFLLAIGMTMFVVTGRRLVKNSKTPWVILFFVSYVFSSLMGLAVDIPLSAIFIRFTTFFSLILYYFLITYVLRETRDLRLLLWATILGGAIGAGSAAFGVDQSIESTDGNRSVGLSSDPNVFGYDLAVCLPVAMALFFASKRTTRKAFAVTCAALAVFGILLSLSRSAFVSMAGMWVLWVIRSGRIDTIKYLIPGLLAALVLLLAAPEDVRNRFTTMTDENKRTEDGSIQSRMNVGALALTAFATNPIVGVGNFGWFIWLREEQTGEQHAIHSVYLAVAAYQGLAGLIPFFTVFWMTWRDYNRTRRAAFLYRARQDPILQELGHVAMYLQIAFFGCLVGNIFSTSLDSKALWLLIAFSTVVVTMARQRVQEIESGEPTTVQADDPLKASYELGPHSDKAFAR